MASPSVSQSAPAGSAMGLRPPPALNARVVGRRGRRDGELAGRGRVMGTGAAAAAVGVRGEWVGGWVAGPGGKGSGGGAAFAGRPLLGAGALASTGGPREVSARIRLVLAPGPPWTESRGLNAWSLPAPGGAPVSCSASCRSASPRVMVGG